MINKVEICGVNTSKLKVLKESEKIELLKRIREFGDEDARARLVNGNLRLVLSVVQKFTNRGENLDDLFQVGCIGLIKSIDNFDTNHNVRFSTYAVPMNVFSRNTFERICKMAVDQTLEWAYEVEKVSDFIRQYKELQPCSAADYNKRREANSATWLTIAHICGVNKWYELIEYCDLEKPVKLYPPVKRKAKTDFVVHIKTDLDEYLDKLYISQIDMKI